MCRLQEVTQRLKSAVISALLLASLLTSFAYAVPAQEPLETSPSTIEENLEQENSASEFEQWALKTWNKLNPQTGEIKLLGEVATLNVPDDFYYLSPDDAKIVLEEIWGNPPSSHKGLGMLFPAGTTPFNTHSWGVTIDYVEEGFVKDDDADDIDYDELLANMIKDVRKKSQQRVDQGFESIELVGWASPPYYDKNAKKLHWAKEYQFGSQTEHTLNYNIRILGRRGYLLLNFIASVNQLDAIQSRIPQVLEIAEFDQGHQYTDFDPDIDDVAAYGIGALVAGKVLAKTGIIASVLFALKKFWVILFVAIGGLWKLITKGRNNE